MFPAAQAGAVLKGKGAAAPRVKSLPPVAPEAPSKVNDAGVFLN